MNITDAEKITLVKEWRKSNGYTQQQAADELGYSSRVTVGYFETGSRRIPDWVLSTINLLKTKKTEK
jgi:transcriptional regulator with XRE-family HTH domain